MTNSDTGTSRNMKTANILEQQRSSIIISHTTKKTIDHFNCFGICNGTHICCKDNCHPPFVNFHNAELHPPSKQGSNSLINHAIEIYNLISLKHVMRNTRNNINILIITCNIYVASILCSKIHFQ